MSDDLTNERVRDTFPRLLQISNDGSNPGVDLNLRDVRDGKGEASALQLSTISARVNGALTVTGAASLAGLAYPSSDGTNGQVLATDGAGNLAFTSVSGTGDVTGPASATDNTLPRYDGTTGKALQGSGIAVDDANNVSGIANLTVTGTPVLAGLTYPTADGSNGQVMTTDGAGNLSFTAVSGTGDVVGPASATDNAVARFDTTTGKAVQNSAVTIDDSGNVTGVANFTITGTPSLAGLSYPTADGTSGQVLTTDGSGTLTFSSVSGSGDVVGPASATDNALARFDTTTGKLLQNGVAILDDSGNLTGLANLTATGTATLGGIAYPTADGTNGQVLTTDGSGTLTFTTIGGGGTVDVVSNVATDTILGRITAGSGDSEELTPAQVRTLINVEDGATADQTGSEIVSAIDTQLGQSGWQTASDMNGPASSTDNAVPRFDGTGGKTLQASGVIVDDSDNVSGIANLTATGTPTLAGIAYPTTDGTSGQVLQTNGSGTLSFATPSGGGLTRGSTVTTTSGTSQDVTGIPTATTYIRLVFDGVSIDNADELALQLGDSGGMETTGYNGAILGVLQSNSAFYTASTSAFILTTQNTAGNFYGTVELFRKDASSNVWSILGAVWQDRDSSTTDAANFCGGAKELTGNLTQLRLLTLDGGANFNGGGFGLAYSSE